MRGSTWLFAAFATMALPGCQINPPLSGEITLRDDAFRPYREYTTGFTRTSSYPDRIGVELVVRVDRKTGKTSTLVSLRLAYEGRRRRKYQSARNARAEGLRVHVVSRH